MRWIRSRSSASGSFTNVPPSAVYRMNDGRNATCCRTLPVAASTLDSNTRSSLSLFSSAAQSGHGNASLTRPAGLPVQGLLEKYNLGGAVGTTEHLAPDGVVDPPLGLAVGVQGLVHPAEFPLDVVEQRLRPASANTFEIEGQAVVGGDEAGERRQVVLDRAPETPMGRTESLLGPLCLKLISGSSSGAVPHHWAATPVMPEPAKPSRTRSFGFGVMEYRRHDREMRYFGVITVRPIDRRGSCPR